MSLSLNLFLALFLLAPGFGLFAGVYSTRRHPFRPTPPEPSSIPALALVSMGALGIHALSAWGFAAMDAGCRWTAVCAIVPFDPSPYAELLGLRSSAASLHPWATAWLLTVLLLDAAFGFFVGRATVRLTNKTGWFDSALYGWFNELLKIATTQAHLFTVYVITDAEKNGRFIGYEGSLIDLRQNSAGELRSVALKDCEPFLLEIQAIGPVRHDPPEGAPPIPFLLVDGARIRNIAFRVYLDPQRLTPEERARLMAAGELVAENEPAATR